MLIPRRDSEHPEQRRLTRRALLIVSGGGAVALLAACSNSTTSATASTAASSAAPATSSQAAAPQTSSAAAAPTVAPTAAPTVQPVQVSTAVPATPTAAAQAAASGAKNAWGRQLPADAAAASDQTLVSSAISSGTGYKAMDFYEAVYARAPLADNFNVPLTRIDTDFNVHPGHAESWDVSADSLTWTFHLKQGVKWTDGAEVTANDFVQTFRYSADPKHAWDFTWYWQGVIKNYDAAVKGTMPTSQIGVSQGSDPYTLIIETEVPVPYLPAQLLYSWPLSAAGLAKYNSGTYNTNPATSISSGPFKLTQWEPASQVTIGPNAIYTGDLTPYVQQQTAHIFTGGSDFQRFQAGEIDSVEVFRPDILAAQADSRLKDLHLYTNPQDFRTYYAFFDVTSKPWDNIKVRQAFAHAVDRNAIIKAILAPLAIPAYGFLMPGYPAAVTAPLMPLTNFDPAMAKQLLSDAGYPGGKGFPDVTFYIRGGGPTTDPQVTQALAAGWQQVLGVKVSLQNLDQPTFMTKLNNKPTQMPFGWISYGMDYFDASNMLGVWLGGGRHNWNNAQYDSLVKQANPLTDQTKRNATYAEAQKLLTGDAAGIFVYHQLHGYYFQPYYQGGAYMGKDKYGYDGQEWPGIGTATTAYQSIYVTKDVTTLRKSL